MSAYRRLEVDVVGRDSGFSAVMNRMNSGVTRFASGLRAGRGEASLFNKQIMAIGTTARYYLAGQLVFGVMAATRNLGEFKTQLGEIDALASRLDSKGNLQGLGGQLGVIGEQALLMSNKFGVAVGEVESYMQRFYTAFKPTGTPQQRTKEMEDFVNAHLELVTMLGARAGDPNALAGGLAGLIRAMPGGEKAAGSNAKTLSNYFARIITSSPNLTGQDIAGAAGRLASAKTLSHMSVRDVLAAFGLAAETGGSPAVITRGMTQLLGQSLLHPTRPQSLRTYQSAGLPTDPNSLAALGGTHVLEQLIRFVQQGAPGSKTRAMNLDAIYNAFSRQESVRQFVNLLANGGVPALKNFQKGLDEAAKTNYAHQAAQKRLNQSILMRMGNARTNLGISLMSGADWPLEHLIAQPIIGVSNAAIRHRTATSAIVGGTLALGAANGLRRLGAFDKLGRFGKLGRFIGTASGIEQAAIGSAISKEELPAAIAGGATSGTRANPYWVIISPLSWSVGSPGGFSQPTGNKTSTDERVGKTVWSWLKGGSAPFIGGVKSIGLKGTGIIGAAVTEPLWYNDLVKWMSSGHGRAVPPGHPMLSKYASNSSYQGLQWTHDIPAPIQNVLDRFAGGKLSADRAEAMLRRLQPGGPGNPIHIDGSAKLDVTVHTKHPDGSTSKTTKRGVPVKLWGAKQFPSAQGKAGSRKGASSK